MTTNAERIATRQNARDAKLATRGVRVAQTNRRYAEEARAEGDTERAAYLIGYAERAEAIVRALGRCIRCGRTLSDPESIARGYGPDCARLVS